jgi:hypothetical protein
MHSSPRNIRKRIKARFHEVLQRRKTWCTKKAERPVGVSSLHVRQPAIFALRPQRTRSREARLAISGNGHRLPPYIRALLRAEKAAGALHVPPVSIAPGWPHENLELERVDRLLAEVREAGKKSADDSPPFHNIGGPTDEEAVLSEVVIAVAEPPPGALPATKEVAVALSKAADRKDRQFVEARALQDLIAGEVRTHPGCEAFVGVLLEKVKPKSSLDTNWDLLGVKFGKADRKTVNAALVAIVSRMKGEFRLSDELS